MYVCPECGLAEFHSENDLITCKKCGAQIRYLPTKELEGVGKPFPFRFVSQWYGYQEEYINSLDVTAMTEKPLYREHAGLSEVLLYQRKRPLRERAEFCLYGARGVIDPGKENELVLPFSEVSAASVLGRNKLNLYHQKTVYQVKGDKRFNAVKYVHLFHRYRNISKGEENGKFLGL